MISVIIPYNKDRGYLGRAVESIRKQDVDHEIILSHSDASVAVNFNNGLAKARGEYCKFVCEDDYLMEGALAKLEKGIQGFTWVFANALQSEAVEWVYRPGDYCNDFWTLDANLKTNRIHGGTTLYNTEVLKEIGGMNEDLWTAEEYDMHLKLWSMGHAPNYIDETVYVHTLWGGQKSKVLRRTHKNERDEEIRRIQSLYSDKV